MCPNWCENNLTIKGDKKTLDKFIQAAKRKNTDLSLQKLVPMPKELENTKADHQHVNQDLIDKYGADNWYDWQVKNWGTKWDIEATLLKDLYNNSNIPIKLKDKIFYEFDSAWAPPIDAFITISKKFPTLDFSLRYDEPNMGFKGTAKIKNGKVLSDSYKDY